MKLKFFLLLLLLQSSFGLFAQSNEHPYAIFGYEGKVLKTPQERQHLMLLIPNTDTTSNIAVLGIEPSQSKYYFFDKNNNLIYEDTLNKEQTARFLSVDPLAPDYPELTPFQFAGNIPIRAVDIDGLEPSWDPNTVYDGYVERGVPDQKTGIITDWEVVAVTWAVHNQVNHTNIVIYGNRIKKDPTWQYSLWKNANSLDRSIKSSQTGQLLFGREGVESGLLADIVLDLNPANSASKIITGQGLNGKKASGLDKAFAGLDFMPGGKVASEGTQLAMFSFWKILFGAGKKSKEVLSSVDDFKRLLEPVTVGNKTLYRGTTGSEVGSKVLFLTDNVDVATTYIKNGGEVMKYTVPEYSLKLLQTSDKLQTLKGIHGPTGKINNEYMFMGENLVEALNSIAKPFK